MKFQDILDKGITFTSQYRKLTPYDIAALERRIQAKLPEIYVDYLLHANGGDITCPFIGNNLSGYVSVIHWPDGNDEYTTVQYMFDIDTVVSYYTEWKSHLPPHTIVIATDPGTTFYLLGIGPDNFGKIFAWELTAVNRMENPDTAGYAYLGFICDSFVELFLTLQSVDVFKD